MIEHRRVKIIIYSLLPIFIFTIFGTYTTLPSIEGILFPQIYHVNTYDIIYVHIYYYLRFFATLVFASALLKTIFLISRKDFRFYFARACMRLVSKKEEELEKMRYLIKGLKSYNRYISKQFRFQINDFKIYSKIINSPTKERSESMKLVTEAFECEKIEVVNHLTGFLGDHDDEQVVAMDSIGNRLQRWGTDVGGLISAIVGIIGAVIAIITYFQHPSL